MNNGFDYITSGNYAGDWLQIQFLAETVATLTPHTGDSVTGTFAAGQQLVGTFVEVNVTSGVILAYRRGATAKRLLTGLLDTYGGAAAAYSLRKLRVAYSGSAIRVRESGSNTEADIGFNADGTLNTTALLAHCGANDGFVTTWYDQSGNSGRNAAQTNVLYQPQIVSGGSVVLENNKPAIKFDGSNDYFQLPYSQGSLSAFLYTNVFAPINNTSFQSLIDFRDADNDGSRIILFDNGTSLTSTNFDDAIQNYTATQQIITGVFDGTNLSSVVNGVSGTPISGTATNATTNGRIGVLFNSLLLPIHGNLQETIIYFTDQSTNRTAIESNINAHYNIYP